ncbi:unnamed protein product [Aphanomyces euteiches]|nr:hypothetical protein AeRB84_011149 [Aphanomyces euteiches]
MPRRPFDFLHLIRRCNRHDESLYLPLTLQAHSQSKNEVVVGKIRKDWIQRLEPFQDVFDWSRIEAQVHLHPCYDTEQLRTAAIQRVAKAMKAEKWRDEAYGARRLDSITEPWFRVDRSASTFFGISQFGCHLNGFVRHSAHPHDLSIWLAVRDPSKTIDPGKLDSLVGGGLPWGVSPRENMLKECEEEAGFHRDQLAQDMVSTGVLTWVSDEPYGFKFNTMHVYDVALPPSWTPLNQDGEVASFKLWSVDEVLDALQTCPDDFKPDICHLLIDFFIRHGILTPESCIDFVSLCSELHAQAPF